MMRLIDTHSHLYDEAFDTDRRDALQRAIAAGVDRIVLPAIDSESHAALFELCKNNPTNCFAMMGLHPTSVNDNPRWREELELVGRHLQVPPKEVGQFCAVGEIGIDLYWSRDFREQQCEAFEQQIEWALQYELPIVVHTRDAWDEVVESVRKFRGRGLRGVFHAFSGSLSHYHELRECGDFVFGIGGVVTFKKSPLVEVVRAIPLEELVLETDCPYLTPSPHRGKRNESAYITYICDKVAEAKEIAPEKVAATTTATAERLFKGITQR